ncbi:PQQ-binding-like beta-propeller repeat protein [Candidatus Bathyarchaeota archaeon]|nr:PQQ-binding-like beta-propeller repeat protein [Candidatus Bathyarchaeota archaeon]
MSLQTIGFGPTAKNYLINWTTAGTTNNFTERIVSNITFALSSISVADYNAGVAVYANPNTPPEMGAWYGTSIMVASLKTGQLLWNITDTDTLYSPMCVVADHGKVAMAMMNRHWNAYDLLTGEKAWESELTGYPWGTWWAYSVASAYGLLYGCSYDGVYAFDWDDGHIVWHYSAGDAGYETPYGTWPFYSFGVDAQIADGKLYTYNSEHTPQQPLTRGWKLHCINATTGEGIWKIKTPGSVGAIADGYMSVSCTDGYMYVYGKGKSATTVTASPKTIAKGAAVLIEGTVLDQSPAQPGTPCVSKESMALQMEYLHKQHPIPANVTGVPVSLDAIDPNGNYVHIGTVTSDAYTGMFKKMWTPEVPGEYTVIATFMGDESYGSSYAETAVSVVEAPEATPEPEPAAAPDNTPLFYAITAAAVAIIIAVAIATVLTPRKRP